MGERAGEVGFISVPGERSVNMRAKALDFIFSSSLPLPPFLFSLIPFSGYTHALLSSSCLRSPKTISLCQTVLFLPH